MLIQKNINSKYNKKRKNQNNSKFVEEEEDLDENNDHQIYLDNYPMDDIYYSFVTGLKSANNNEEEEEEEEEQDDDNDDFHAANLLNNDALQNKEIKKVNITNEEKKTKINIILLKMKKIK
jgi:hypothetical protein